MDFSNNTITINLANVLQQFYNYICTTIEANNTIEFDELLDRKLGLEEGISNEIIMSIYWTIEDTDIAINEYIEFQLQGPTRNKRNLGEKYLRLYGILNAVNIQKSVLIELYEVFKLSGKNQLRRDLNNIEIIKLRNRLAAHCLDYKIEGKKNYFRISQYSLDSESNEIEWIGKNEVKKSNLKYELEQFKSKFNKLLHSTLKNIIDKKLDLRSKIFLELDNYLNLIEERINGNIVTDMNGEYSILRFVKENFEEE